MSVKTIAFHTVFFTFLIGDGELGDSERIIEIVSRIVCILPFFVNELHRAEIFLRI